MENEDAVVIIVGELTLVKLDVVTGVLGVIEVAVEAVAVVEENITNFFFHAVKYFSVLTEVNNFHISTAKYRFA